MRITFDPVKNERNIRERALSFESVAAFDFDTALVQEDDRRPYGESAMSPLVGCTAACASCASPGRPGESG